MVWDSDVSLRGISASYLRPLGGGLSVKAAGLYFFVDEAAAGQDSAMFGGQLALDYVLDPKLKFELAVGFYDYRLNSLAGGDPGDFRSNRFQSGRYLSDFNLLDVLGAVTWQGPGAKWPVRVVGNYVKNLGSMNGEDTGVEFNFSVGRTNNAHDWRFSYGYTQVETDAVLAAYSHDNTGIATNYLQRTLAADYTANPNLIFTATLYHYRPKNPLYAGTNDPTDWLNRFRFNALVVF